jgi:WD40 repeat protein
MKKHLTTIIFIIYSPLFLLGQSDCKAVQRAGENAWEKREYQFAIDNYRAALTCSPSLEEGKSLRDTISKIETQYREFLKKQRLLSRRMERSNELLLKAFEAAENGDNYLALQLAHYACKMSDNSNLVALKYRNHYLKNTNYTDKKDPSKILVETMQNRAVFIGVSPDSLNATLLIVTQRGKNEPDTTLSTLDIPPIKQLSCSQDAEKTLALCTDGKIYWIDLRNQTKSIPALGNNGTITSIAVWKEKNLAYYGLGYDDGRILVYDAIDGKLECDFNHQSQAVSFLDILNVERGKKSLSIKLLMPENGNAVIMSVKKLFKDNSLKKAIEPLSSNVITASVSSDKSKIAILRQDNGIEFFSGTGKGSEPRYPFDFLNGAFRLVDIVFASDNKGVFVTLIRQNVDGAESKIIELISTEGKRKVQNEDNTPKETIRHGFTPAPPLPAEMIKENKKYDLNATQIKFIPDGTSFVALLQMPKNEVKLYKTGNPEPSATYPSAAGVTIQYIQPSRSGKQVLMVTNQKEILLWNTTNQSTITIKKFDELPKSMAFSAKDDLFAIGHGKKLSIYSTLDGKPRGESKILDANISALCTSPKGDTILVGLEDGNSFYCRFENITNIITSRIGRSAGTIEKVAFSSSGKYSLLLSKDNTKKTYVLDIVDNTTNMASDRRYFYESPDEFAIIDASFSNDDQMILLSKRKETMLLSSSSLKPGYEIQILPSPHKNDYIKEAYLIDKNAFIATVSESGDLEVQRSPIDYLDTKMEKLPLLDQIKYKIADPDSLTKYAHNIEELDASITYLINFFAEEEDLSRTIRDTLIVLLKNRIGLSDNINQKEKRKISEYYLTLARATDWQALDQELLVLPQQALNYETTALRYCVISWDDFKNRSYAEKSNAEETLSLIYNELSFLSICNKDLVKAKIYADSSLLHSQNVRTCSSFGISNQIMLELLQNTSNPQNAYLLFDQYKSNICFDRKERSSVQEALISDLEYLQLVFDRRDKQQKVYLKAIDAALLRCRGNLKRKY